MKVKELSGQVSVTFGYDDEVAPAKILYLFSKEHENLKLIAGLVNGELLSQEELINLAQLPSKAELLAKLVGSLAAPMSGMLSVLQGNLKSLMYILSNIKPESEAKA